MMRIFFLFFLLINAAYFFMHFGDAGNSASSNILQQPPLPQGVDKLVLLRERGLGVKNVPRPIKKSPLPTPQKPHDAPPLKTAVVETVKSAQKVAPKKSHPPACFTLGPFTKASAVSRSTKALKAWGVAIDSREVSKRTPKNYWVYLPASKSYRAAKRKVRALQKKGLADLFIMGNGSHKNAISLGLFKQEATADERLMQVKKLGLNAVLETQYRLSKQTWLDLTVTDAKAATVAAITEIADSQQQTNLTQRKCQ